MGGGTRQMLFVIAAMALLSQITIVVNDYVMGNVQSSIVAEATITATGFAEGMLREVVTEAFDEKILTKGVATPDSLTPVASLGREAGEVYPAIDDIDDFHNYERNVSTERLGNFRVRTKVWYVTPLNLDNPAATRTFYKRVTVTVDQNLSLEYDVTATQVLSY